MKNKIFSDETAQESYNKPLKSAVGLAFKKYNKIPRFDKCVMQITQKIHGTNAQIYIYEEDGKLKIRAGSRNRWLFVGDDNYGFAYFVEENKEELIEKFKEGTHYGEWAGPGINSGEGLVQKVFVLFNKYGLREEDDLPERVRIVPMLYEGKYDTAQISIALEDLKNNGSRLVEGFMRPEGVVTNFSGNHQIKNVFDKEEVKWSGSKKIKAPKIDVDYSHLLQPMRLDKLLSSDSQLLEKYPTSLPSIVKLYVGDLVEEGEIVGDEDEVRATRKGATKQIFQFIRRHIEED